MFKNKQDRLNEATDILEDPAIDEDAKKTVKLILGLLTWILFLLLVEHVMFILKSILPECIDFITDMDSFNSRAD